MLRLYRNLWVSPKDLENFKIHVLQETNVELDRSKIVASHRLGKTDRTIVKFLNRKDAVTVFLNKENYIIRIFLGYFPMRFNTRTIWPEGFKANGEMEVSPKKENSLSHRISARTTGTYMV